MIATVQVGDVAKKVTKGTTPSTFGKSYLTEGIPFLRAQNIQSPLNLKGDLLYIDEETNASLSRSCIEPKDVLITIAGSIGRSAVVPDDAAPMNCNQAVAIIRLNDQVDPCFLSHWLNSPFARKQVLGSTVTATVPNLSLSQIKKLEIPLPSLAEQKRIAAILDNVDVIRCRRQEVLDLADTFLDSVFLKMFGDPVTNPMGWDESSIEDVTIVQGGLSLSSKRKEYPIEMPYLRVANVFRNALNLEEIKTIRVTEKERDRVFLSTGDILIVEGHGNKNEIGRCAVWDGSIEGCLHQNHLIRVRTIEGKATPEYVSRYINSRGGRMQMLRSGRTTSGLNTISISKVKATRLFVPPVGLQEDFSLICHEFTAKTCRKLESLNLVANNLFSSLQQRAFRGDL